MSKTPVIGKRSHVVEALARSIRRGELGPGERLDGENELARRFDVSRGTIRQALDELKRRNLITTRTGIGSFVTFDGVALDQSIGWARALRDAGGDIHTEVLGIDPVPWPGNVLAAIVNSAHAAAANDLDESAPGAIRIRRLRRIADGTPVSLEVSHVPALGPLADAPRTGLVDGSLWASLAAAELYAATGVQDVRVLHLDEDDARLLETSPGEAFLGTERTSFAADGRFVEHVVALLHPDHFRLSLTFGESL